MGITSFNPDQISSTAQTFTSTSPVWMAKFRIISSEMSAKTFDDFFGQDIQIIPFNLILCFNSGNNNLYSSWLLVKR